jgi:hypothetical protein
MNRDFKAAANKEVLLVDNAVITTKVATVCSLMFRHLEIAQRSLGAKSWHSFMHLAA